MEQLGSYCTDFREIWYFIIFGNTVGTVQVSLKSEKNKGYFTWRPIYFFIISRSVLRRMRNVSGRISRENYNTLFMFNNFFFKNRAFHEIIWKNTVQPDRPQMSIRRMRIACCKPRAKDTHSEYVIHVAFSTATCCATTPQCHVMRALSVLLNFYDSSRKLTVSH